MHLYRGHINIFGGGGHTKDGRSTFGMLWEGHTPCPSAGQVSFGTLNVAPLMIDTKEFPEIKTTRAYARGDDRGPRWVPTPHYRRTSCSQGVRGLSSHEPVCSVRLVLPAGVWPRDPSACWRGRGGLTWPFLLVRVSGLLSPMFTLQTLPPWTNDSIFVMERTGPAISQGFSSNLSWTKKSPFLLISKCTEKRMEKTSLCVLTIFLDFMHLSYGCFISYASYNRKHEGKPTWPFRVPPAFVSQSSPTTAHQP